MSSGRLVTVFRPVVEPLVLPALHPRHDRPLRGAVAAQLVGNHHPGCPTLALQQLAHQSFRRGRVPAALHQDVENDTLLVDRPPKPVPPVSGGDHTLVQGPFVPGAGKSAADRVGEGLPELQSPLPEQLNEFLTTNKFVDKQTCLRHHLPHWEPNRVQLWPDVLPLC